MPNRIFFDDLRTELICRSDELCVCCGGVPEFGKVDQDIEGSRVWWHFGVATQPPRSKILEMIGQYRLHSVSYLIAT